MVKSALVKIELHPAGHGVEVCGGGLDTLGGSARLLTLIGREGNLVRMLRLCSASTALREREPSSEARWRLALSRASLASRRLLLRAERSRVACCFWDFFDGKAAASFLTRVVEPVVSLRPVYYRKIES